jgi:hypothetical protein
LDASFVRAFWAFIRAGKYQAQQAANGERRYYRFLKPEKEEYPFMLELFSRKPDILDLAEGVQLTPIPADDESYSLSAILLNDTYYAFLHSGKIRVWEIPIVGPEHLIPLKALAWLDLAGRKKAGEKVDAKSITKHKNDVFRLYRVIDPAFKPEIPKDIRNDMISFLDAMEIEKVDLKNLGINDRGLDSILGELRRIYVHN